MARARHSTEVATTPGTKHGPLDVQMAWAQQGDAEAMARLRGMLEAQFGAQWETKLSSPTDAVRDTLLEAEMGHNLLARETWVRRTKALQRDLEGNSPTPLERILCERVATCWLQAQLSDLRDTWTHSAAKKTVGSETWAHADYHSKRAARAHRRYLDATLALARVRRLLAPVVAQFNIAQPGAKQLNVTASPPVIPRLAEPATQPVIAGQEPSGASS